MHDTSREVHISLAASATHCTEKRAAVLIYCATLLLAGLGESSAKHCGAVAHQSWVRTGTLELLPPGSAATGNKKNLISLL